MKLGTRWITKDKYKVRERENESSTNNICLLTRQKEIYSFKYHIYMWLEFELCYAGGMVPLLTFIATMREMWESKARKLAEFSSLSLGNLSAFDDEP